MKTVYLQIWEESSSEYNIPNGCTLHIDLDESKDYLSLRYNNRVISKRYESAVCLPIEVKVNDKIFEIIEKEKTAHLNQNEMNNLIEFGDIEVI